jgi:hypothetical protein
MGDLHAWLGAIHKTCVALLAPLDGDYGVETVEDLLNLEPEDIDRLVALLKRSPGKNFRAALAALAIETATPGDAVGAGPKPISEAVPPGKPIDLHTVGTLSPTLEPEPGDEVPFFSLRFGVKHGVVPMAKQLQCALAQRGTRAKIIDMMAGGDIDATVFSSIEECGTFVVFGSAEYGEDTGNQACTYYEYKHAFALKKNIILIRMIPFDQEFENLQARVIFNANKLVIPWMLGTPMPPSLPDQILQAMGLVSPAPTRPEVEPEDEAASLGMEAALAAERAQLQAQAVQLQAQQAQQAQAAAAQSEQKAAFEAQAAQMTTQMETQATALQRQQSKQRQQSEALARQQRAAATKKTAEEEAPASNPAPAPTPAASAAATTAPTATTAETAVVAALQQLHRTWSDASVKPSLEGHKAPPQAPLQHGSGPAVFSSPSTSAAPAMEGTQDAPLETASFFAELDRDQDGWITIEDLQHKFPGEDILCLRQMIAGADYAGTGFVSEDNLTRVLQEKAWPAYIPDKARILQMQARFEGCPWQDAADALKHADGHAGTAARALDEKVSCAHVHPQN